MTAMSAHPTLPPAPARGDLRWRDATRALLAYAHSGSSARRSAFRAITRRLEAEAYERGRRDEREGRPFMLTQDSA